MKYDLCIQQWYRLRPLGNGIKNDLSNGIKCDRLYNKGHHIRLRLIIYNI